MPLNDPPLGRMLATPSGWFAKLLKPWDRVAKPSASLVPHTNPRMMIKPVRPYYTTLANRIGDSVTSAPSTHDTSCLDSHYFDEHHATSTPIKHQRVEEDLVPGFTTIEPPTNLRPMEFEIELAYSMAIKELAARPDHLARPKRTLHGEPVENGTALRYRPGCMYLLAESRQPRTRLAEAGRPALSDIASESAHSSPALNYTPVLNQSPRVFKVPSATDSERSLSVSASLLMTPSRLDCAEDAPCATPDVSSPFAGPIHVPGNDMFRDTRQNTAVNKLARLVDTKCGGVAFKVTTELEDDRCVVRIKLPKRYLDYMPQETPVAESFSEDSTMTVGRDDTLAAYDASPAHSPRTDDVTLTVTDFSPLMDFDDDTLVVSDFSPYGRDMSPHQNQPQAVDSLLPQEVVEAPSTPMAHNTQPQSQAIHSSLPQEVVEAPSTPMAHNIQPQSQAINSSLPQEVVEAHDTQPPSQAVELYDQLPHMAVDATAPDSPGRAYLRAFISKSKPALARAPLGERSPNASPSPPKRKLEDKPEHDKENEPEHDKENGRDAKKPRLTKAAPTTPSKPPPRRSVRARAQPGPAASTKSAIPTAVKVGKAPTLSAMRLEQAELARRTSANTRRNRGKGDSLEVVQARYLEAHSSSSPSENDESERTSTSTQGVVWKEPLEEFAPAVKAVAAAKKAATPKPKKAKKATVAPSARPGTPRVTRSRTRSQMV
ncbi:uncharacterized protein F5Z01DRAFT_648591 [Emericellopsis atlantica]|uniref:Uncharacterized protein n=1 Tax=Emericellopsis atlantica TaxID=2614577 RepID=A0A9P8CT75_9HYPO|nr:uncharacterized protein F5Z01DRAFT_648591 [Emericellopsis atlantica]KAG9256531.1 hypothetical protein F5Z01DRAFT_648591 [Emericellopsis atlantica]